MTSPDIAYDTWIAKTIELYAVDRIILAGNSSNFTTYACKNGSWVVIDKFLFSPIYYHCFNNVVLLGQVLVVEINLHTQEFTICLGSFMFKSSYNNLKHSTNFLRKSLREVFKECYASI